MKPRALGLFAVLTIGACERSDESASLTDTVPMPPVDGSILLVSPGSAPAQTIPAPPPDDAIAVGEDTASMAVIPGADSSRPRSSRAPRDTASPRPDSNIGRDSAITGPFIPVPVPPDTG
ncbi:MAG TPA: hypothetical protein VFZ56_05285 [Gemmatimonadaceae bacterium]